VAQDLRSFCHWNDLSLPLLTVRSRISSPQVRSSGAITEVLASWPTGKPSPTLALKSFRGSPLRIQKDVFSRVTVNEPQRFNGTVKLTPVANANGFMIHPAFYERCIYSGKNGWLQSCPGENIHAHTECRTMRIDEALVIRPVIIRKISKSPVAPALSTAGRANRPFNLEPSPLPRSAHG
jgi:hypothetical protein